MKKFLFLLAAVLCISAVFTSRISAQVIYKVNSPDSANVRVFVTTDPEQADLKVFSVTSIESVNRDGLFFETTVPEEAALKIYITTNQEDANICIYYTDNEQDAGWITKDKRHFFRVPK